MAALRSVIAETGALDHVEALVERRTAEAVAALAGAPVEDAARDVLLVLAEAATKRRG